jgi:hypothetical protein
MNRWTLISAVGVRRANERLPNVSYRSKDGVIGRQLVDSRRFWVLRFRLMVKRGPQMRLDPAGHACSVTAMPDQTQ